MTELKWPTITIVMPSYNQGQFLEAAIQSVLQQNYPNLEFIIMDGGSTDGSVDIIRRYSDRIDYWISEKDGGQSAAINAGFARSKGDILGWLCSDDMLEPGCLREVGSFFSAHPKSRVVYGDATYIRADAQVIRRFRNHPFSRFILLYDYDYIPQPSTFWRKDIWEQVGGLDEELVTGMDFDLFLRFSEVSRIHFVRRQWSQMREHPAAKATRLEQDVLHHMKLVRRRYTGEESEWSRKLKQRAARLLRISMKLVTGGYSALPCDDAAK